jgi:DNA polymerase IV
VDAAVDQVRQRYGKSALTRGVLVGRYAGLEVPHLPD